MPGPDQAKNKSSYFKPVINIVLHSRLFAEIKNKCPDLPFLKFPENLNTNSRKASLLFPSKSRPFCHLILIQGLGWHLAHK